MIYKYEIKEENNQTIIYLYIRTEEEFASEILAEGKNIVDQINRYIILLQQKVDFQKVMIIINGISIGTLIFNNLTNTFHLK